MCAEDMNNERDDGKVTKESFKEYTYVMVSTLNQMVNYIPLKHFTFKEVVNITVDDSQYADNAKWDTNLTDVLGSGVSISPITFKQSEITNLTTIKNRLNEQLKGKEKIFWNITGGQRPFVLAIQQIAKEDDVICYLEGNNSQMVLLQNNNEIKDVKSYSLEGLTIETALKLMGFEIKDTKTSHRNLIQKYDEVKEEREFYLKFLDEYIKIKDSNIREKLLKNLIHLNKNYPSEKPATTFQDRVKTFEEARTEAKNEIKKILTNLTSELVEKELEQGKSEGDKKVKSFGFILEKLAGYKILEVANGKIADITFGEKINYLREEDRVDKKPTDEFDIALLTKNGKFMIFECKSGGMSGDVAKSTNYSTYAVSGVYGLPILITPLLASEISNLNTLGEEYETIKSAVKSAKRASLEVWGIDEIATKIEKYIGERRVNATKTLK